MFVDLIDTLRCPHAHEDTWLVAAASETRARCVARGTLGCPVCRSTFPIDSGVAHFDQSPAPPAPSGPMIERDAVDAEALRLAALLGLTSAGGLVAVAGTWDAAVDPLLHLSDARVLVVEPASPYAPREPVGALAGAWLPVAAGSLRGVALDEGTAAPERLVAAVTALRGGGRLVAPTAASLPGGVRELARDARHWVAERDTSAGTIVPLRRAR